MNSPSLAQLTERFRSAEHLPPLPETAIKIVEILDRPDPCPKHLLTTLAHDAQLAANLIRAASTAAFYGLGSAAVTLESAILRLGLDQIRMLTMSFSIRSALWRKTPSEGFDPRRFAEHSNFIADASAGLVRREMYLGRAPSPAEAFAIGLLHDLPACLLAHVAPTLFDLCWNRAREDQTTFDGAFEALFDESTAVLAEAAARAWALPQIDAGNPEWLLAAHDLAALSGATLEEWPVEARSVIEARVRDRLHADPAAALLELMVDLAA